MITILQIGIVLILLILLVLFAFKPKPIELIDMPEEYRQILNDYVKFYWRLDEIGKQKFEERVQRFLSSVRIVGANAEVEDLDRLLVAAGAIIPVFYISDWEYINLHEVLLYPGNFNRDFDQHGADRSITGMVGSGAMQNTMIISKWELRQGFIDSRNGRNTAIHEFVHLVDKMDGTFDGVPEILLERKYIPRWKELVITEIERIKRGQSDIDFYGATNEVEFFAVVSEYFFELPELFRERHPDLNELLEKVFTRKSK